MRTKRAAPERPAFDEVFRHVASRLISANLEELGHIRPQALLFVAGAARREAAATIRPLFFGGGASSDGAFIKPRITIGHEVIRYEICLRPRFFRICTPEQRLRILAHELWHIDPSFDGSLDPTRRHAVCSASSARSAVEHLVKTVAVDGEDAPAMLAYRGELRLSAWLNRPPSRLPHTSDLRGRYSEADLYAALIEQR